MKKIFSAMVILALLLSACARESASGSDAAASAPASSASAGASSVAENASSSQAIHFIGTYTDDMGSDLIISRVSENEYTVDYSIYKLTYLEGASGTCKERGSVLHFAGTDDNGNALAADIAPKDGQLVVTLTQSAYKDCPAGTEFTFYPANRD